MYRVFSLINKRCSYFGSSFCGITGTADELNDCLFFINDFLYRSVMVKYLVFVFGTFAFHMYYIDES